MSSIAIVSEDAEATGSIVVPTSIDPSGVTGSESNAFGNEGGDTEDAISS